MPRGQRRLVQSVHVWTKANGIQVWTRRVTTHRRSSQPTRNSKWQWILLRRLVLWAREIWSDIWCGLRGWNDQEAAFQLWRQCTCRCWEVHYSRAALEGVRHSDKSMDQQLSPKRSWAFIVAIRLRYPLELAQSIEFLAAEYKSQVVPLKAIYLIRIDLVWEAA